MVGKKQAPDTRPPAEKGYSYDELRPLVAATLRAGLSVLVRGHPGIGKSALARDLAVALGRPLIDIRLAQRDPAEIGGVYFPNRERGVLELFPPEWVRRACDGACFVFLDEINAAVTRLHQAVAYQIVLEHRIGPFAFHPETRVMAAGNLEEDNALVTTLSAALCNRFAHFIMRADVASWLAWGAAAGIQEPILAHIKREGASALYAADGEYAFPSPRTWEMASRVLNTAAPEDQSRAVAACVGSRAAAKFFDFLRIYRRVDVAGIVRRGRKMDFTRGSSADPSFVYAAVFAVAAFAATEQLADKDLAHLLAFLRSPGLDSEFVFLFLRQIYRRSAVVERLKRLPEFRRLAAGLVGLRIVRQ